MLSKTRASLENLLVSPAQDEQRLFGGIRAVVVDEVHDGALVAAHCVDEKRKARNAPRVKDLTIPAAATRPCRAGAAAPPRNGYVMAIYLHI